MNVLLLPGVALLLAAFSELMRAIAGRRILSESESNPSAPRPRAVDLLRLAGAVTVLGMIGVILALFLGFEEAPDGLFLISALCVFAAPIVLLLHLWLTKTISRAEKQSLLKAFVSRRALHAAADYVARQEHASTAS